MSDIRFVGTNPIATRQAMEFWQSNTGFVAVRDVPLILVSAPAGKLSILDQDVLNIDDVQLRAKQASEADKSTLGFLTVDYKTDERALEFDVSASIEKQIAAEVGTSTSVTVPRALALKANIHTEGRFSALWSAASWYRTVTGAAADGADNVGSTAQDRVFWSDVTKDPIAALRQEIDLFLIRTGLLPTNLRLGRKLFTTVASHPLVRAQVALMIAGSSAIAGMTMVATEAQLSQLLGVKVSVSSGIRNTAKQGLAATNEFIVNPDDALLTFDTPGSFTAQNSDDGSPPVVDMGSPTGFARVAWTGVAPQGFQIRSFARPEIGAGGSMAHVLDLFQGYVIVNPKFGTFFDGMRQ